MKAISYARASQDRTGEELSVDRQREDQRRHIEARGWHLVTELVDNDTSAAGKRKRPGFERALEMVIAREAQVIVSTDMTRLTRGKSRDEVRLLELGVETGLHLSFVRAPDLDLSTAAGRLSASILIAAARHEIEQKGERQSRASIQAAQRGKWMGGRRPFGYEADGVTVRPAEAEAVRTAFDGLLLGRPLGSLAREWNTQGFTTPQTRRDGTVSRWTSQSIRLLLLNPRYAGLRSRGRGKDREVMAVAEWPAIIPESTWRAAYAVLTDPSRARPAYSGKSLLTGVALCGVCGSLVHAGAAPARKGGPSRRTYRCRGALGHIGRGGEPIDEFASAVAIARLSRPDAADLLVDDQRPDADQLRNDLIALRQRRRGVLALVADGTFTDAEARDQAAELARQIADVEAKLTDAGRADILGPLINADDVAEAWAALDIDRRRAVIDTLMVVRIHPAGRGTRTFRPESIGIEWKA